MRGIALIVLAALLVPLALAVQGPFAFNGKQYYTVTSTDSSEDTGAEVCAKVGMTCVGYTATGSEVCQMAHPSAQTSSGFSGDRSGVYCDGTPQTGECALKRDTCHTCEACSAGVDCTTPIGNLYREMYVECAPSAQAACNAEPTSRSVQELVSEAPAVNGKLQTCSLTLPSTFGAVTSNGNVLVDITKSDASHEYFTITMVKGRVAGFQHGQQSCSQKITLSEDDANALLGSPDRAGAFKYLYANKRIRIQGCTFIRIVTGWVTQPLGRLVVRQTLPPPPPPQTAPQPVSGALLCDFYNAPTKKIVTCGAYKAGDTFCANVMGSTQARAVTCEENGLVLCSVPCDTYSTVKLMNRCAFDLNRARGTQAPPIGSCPAVQTAPVPSGQGRPANCDETYLPGHSGYAQNKALWDSYSAQTDGVCQSQYGRGTPSPCAYTVQLSVSGNPYYLCWYNN